MTIATTIKRRARTALGAVYRRLLAWTRPTAGSRVGSTVGDLARSKTALVAENAFLRHQLVVLGRQIKRPVLTPADRLRLIFLARLVRGWRATLVIVQPETLLRWHRQGFRLVWRAKSRGAAKRPQVSAETVAAIQRLAAENRLWGAERIRGELLKLDIRVARSTIQRYLREARPPRRPGQTWATFLRNHAADIWACDFLPVTDVLFQPVYAFFVIALASRRVVHVGVTRHPTDARVAQQLREATPFGECPRYLIRDNDRKYGPAFSRVAKTSGVTELRTVYRAPRQNSTCERFLGSIRRECLDHLLILGEAHLRRVLLEYARYFNGDRPHQGLAQRVPDAPVAVSSCVGPCGSLRAVPILGDLHYAYARAA